MKGSSLAAEQVGRERLAGLPRHTPPGLQHPVRAQPRGARSRSVLGSNRDRAGGVCRSSPMITLVCTARRRGPCLRSGRAWSATEVFTRETLLADAIRAKRSQAQQGDVFTADIALALRGIVQRIPEFARARRLRHHRQRESRGRDPTDSVVSSVSGAYEPGASYSTMPPTLLMRLPRLPEELEYRFVGKHLLLRDTSANIIVDYMFDVAP